MYSNQSMCKHDPEVPDLPVSVLVGPDHDTPDPNNSVVPSPEGSANPGTVLTKRLQFSVVSKVFELAVMTVLGGRLMWQYRADMTTPVSSSILIEV